MQQLAVIGEHPWLAGLVVFLLSLLIGSFLNVVILRLPIMMFRAFKRDMAEAEFPNHPALQDLTQPYNLIKPDSHCPSCQTPVRAWQNIPLLSWLVLRGRCANCHTAIGLRYPFIELSTALLSLCVLWVFPWGPQLAAMLHFTWLLLAMAVIDFDHQLLPDSLTYALLWLGLLVNSQTLFTDLHSAVYGAIAGYGILWSVYWLFKLATGKEGMGYGDFKLLAALGAWLGISMLPLIILLSSVVGAVIGIAMVLLLGRDKNIPIPFGPYLAAAGWIAALWGDKILAWYLG